MTEAGRPLPTYLRRAAAARRVRTSIRRPWRAIPWLVRWIAPGSWQPDADLRLATIDRAVGRGDRSAARIRLLEPQGVVGTPPARGRARALEVLANELTGDAARTERAVIEFLGQRAPRRETAGRGPAGAASEAIAAAARLRGLGHSSPRIVMTLPALEGNPYTRLMESGYEAAGLASVHVDSLEDAEAIVAARATGGFGAMLLVNASNRLVWPAPDGEAAARIVTSTLATIDRWRAEGVALVVTVHDLAILGPTHAAAERALAQGIADRADRIHVLSASTAEVLRDWLRLDPARTLHIAHPNFDAAYPARPPRDGARASLGIDSVDPVGGGREIVIGMIGLLSPRKGPRRLVDALRAVPDPLPDGRRLRLVMAGRAIDPGGEALIRAAGADPRIVAEFGFVSEDRMPTLLAAIDVAVVPYDRYLNSAWTVLALTAGIPVIAPAGGTAAEVVRPGALATWDPTDPGSLTAALEDAGRLVTTAARAEARRSVADLDAATISRRFAELLAGLPEISVGEPGPPAGRSRTGARRSRG